MLAHVPEDAKRVVSDIEDLCLGELFDTVLLASCQVNHPSASTRASSEEAIEALLSDAGFHSYEWLGETRRWVRAVVG
jgi:hypothetical protein